MPQLSAVIITRNEEANIARCLAALAPVADEVIVVDSHSTDRTAEIARSMGARVVLRGFDSFMAQKNFAIAQAAHDHVLSVDADECPDPLLQKSILEKKADWGPAPGYRLAMLTFYDGQWVRHCGWHPDAKLRLFDRRLGRWAGKNPHERFEFSDGKTWADAPVLPGNLLHYSFPTVGHHLKKARFYAAAGAEFLAKSDRTIWWPQLLVNPLAKWLKIYVLRLGFLDGRAGWHIARIASMETFWKYRAAFLMKKLNSRRA